VWPIGIARRLGWPRMSQEENRVDQEFHIEERAGTHPRVVAVSGEIDVATAPQLRECLHGVIAQGEATVVLDLLGVTFLDSTALGVLVGALKRCRELGGELHVVVADSRIVKIFEITGLTSVFTIADSLESAGVA
jgi:anti-sigma B factor antagonist